LILILLAVTVGPARAARADEGGTTNAGTVPSTEAHLQLAAEPVTASPGDRQAAAEQANMGALIASLTIFVLAIFVGFEVITKVPPTLHTPLMSGSNAISGITLVGALIAAGGRGSVWATILGTIAVALATVNVVGGFLVTHRMLRMFRKR
jgi:H+-translocating NAD(P) transhydrogenase subunit alpha